MSRRSRKRKRRSIGKSLKLYMLITGACLFIALVVSFTIGKLPSFIDRTVSAQIERTIADEMKGAGGMDMDKLKNEFKKRNR